jgi:uncharacterized protein (TIGR02246 family)
LLAVPLFAQTTKPVEDVVRRFIEAQKNYDAASMAKVLAPDYVEISPIGAVDPRDQVLGFYTPEEKAKAGDVTEYRLDDVKTRVYGATAVVIARLPFTMATAGRTTTSAFRCTFVLVKKSGKWLLVSSQYTTIR